MNSLAKEAAVTILLSIVVACAACKRDESQPYEPIKQAPADEAPPYERIDQAVAHVEQGEDGAASEILEDLSAIGYTEASVLLAELILDERIREPEDKAMTLLRNASSKGNVHAHETLARYFGDSGTAHYQPERQLQHLRRAADYGDDGSALALATLLSTSDSPTDLVEAMYWTRIGFARREPEYMMLLSRMAALPDTMDIYDGAEKLMRTTLVEPIVRNGRLLVPSRSWRLRWLVEGMSHVRQGQQDPDRAFFRPLEIKPGEPDGVGAADFVRDLNSSMIVGRAFLLAPEGKSSKESNVTLDESSLWKAIGQMDVVLLSDKITHHWATVWDVDLGNDRIYFLEEYPEQFFLNEGKNATGINAMTHELPNGKLTHSISRKEFSSACQAVITLRHLDGGDPSQEAERALLDASAFILSPEMEGSSDSGRQ